jgi:hypothetical protein
MSHKHVKNASQVKKVSVFPYSEYDRSRAAFRQCLVSGCDRADTPFFLCKKHEVPGLVVAVGPDGQPYVVLVWLVERDGRRYLISLNDFALDDLFDGSQQAFENRLREQGLIVLKLMTSIDEARQQEVSSWILWTPELGNDAWNHLPTES